MLKALLALALVLSSATHAAILRVAEGAGGTGDGSTWADAFPHLRDALAAAVAGDEIWVAAGVYYPDERTGQPDGTSSAAFTLKPEVPLYGGFAGIETLLSQRDPEKHVTILSGDIGQDDANEDGNHIDETSADIVGTNSANVVRFATTNVEGPVSLDGFTITAGSGGQGGGLYVTRPTVSVARCHFRGHKGVGAAAYVVAADTSFVDCSFSGNSALGSGGVVQTRYPTTFTNCRFESNNSNQSCAGLLSYSDVTLTECYFQNNTSVSGPGAWGHVQGVATVGRCIFAGNSSVHDVGAVSNGDKADVSDCVFRSNTGSICGAWHEGGRFTSLLRCFFAGNSSAEDGGAVHAGGFQMKASDCLFQSNTALHHGGAWFESASDSVLTNCTFSGNSADGGGAIGTLFGGGFLPSPVVRNSVLWGNRAVGTTIPPYASVFPGASFDHCIVAGSGGSAAWNLGAGRDLGANLDVNPVFLVPADPAIAPAISGNLQLAHGSPALGGGNNAYASNTTDLVGAPRITNGTVDLGAYEGQNDQFDADGDGLSDAFELAATTPSSRTGLSPEEDSDGDGLTNRQEFAFGLSPQTADSGKAFVPLVIEDQGQRYLSLRYRRNLWALQFLPVEVEHSLDLGVSDPWSTGETTAVTAMPVDGNVEEVTVRSDVPLGSQPADFLRIRAGDEAP